MKLVQFADPKDRTRYAAYLVGQLRGITKAVDSLLEVDLDDQEKVRAILHQISGRAQSIHVTASNRLEGVESDVAPIDPSSIVKE